MIRLIIVIVIDLEFYDWSNNMIEYKISIVFI